MARGETPEGLPATAGAPGAGRPRDVFLFAISGFKPANPAAAQALIARLDGPQTITPERASSQGKAAPARSRTPSSRARGP